jgi:hypothetical protein
MFQGCAMADSAIVTRSVTAAFARARRESMFHPVQTHCLRSG